MMAVHIGIPRDPGRVWFSEPYLRVDIEERDARHFKPGSYAYFPKDDTIRKVVRVERPEDWSVSTITLVLEDGVHQPSDSWEGGAFMTLLSRLPSWTTNNPVIRWLEDEMFPSRYA